jgi:hypothetical protein
VVVHLVDQLTRADLAGVTVTGEPGGLEVATNLSGRATFPDLPIGLYKFASAPHGLKLTGTSVVPASPVGVATNYTTFAAGSTVNVTLEAPRFSADAFNLTTMHRPGTANFLNSNCIACHGDRKNELSAVASIKPFHAMGSVNGHSAVTCDFCHASVDIGQESGANLRRQVPVARCQLCHAGYPNSF